MDEQGLWFGIICGLFVQLLLLMLITLCTNWDNEVRATKASALHFFLRL
jgi:multidrug resistance protein, MATE family